MDSEMLQNDAETRVSDTVAASKHKNIRKINFQFYIFASGCLLLQGTAMCVSSLQSSINIRENIGTKTLAASKISSTVTGLLCVPLLIRKLGYKWAMILGEGLTVVYIAGNFYPTLYIMLTVGTLYGLGGALVWTLMPIYNLLFGQLHGKYGSKEPAVYSRKYASQFFAILRVGRIVASIISYGVLHGTKVESQNYNGTYATNTSYRQENKYEYCGAKDCQNPNVTRNTLNKYVPPNPLSIYLLMGSFCILSLCAIGLHAKFLTNLKVADGIFAEKAKSIKSNTGKKQTYSLLPTIKATLKHAISLKQILLYPFLLYFGIFMAFIYAEKTRAFSSCILGVEKVGLVLIAHDIFHIIASLVSGKLIGYIGRNLTMVIAALLDMSNYIFCSLWRPTEATAYLVYLTSTVFGISDALWKNCTLAVYAEYFRQNQEISFSVQLVGVTIGVTIGYLWSPLFCVDLKIYIQASMMVVAMLAYGVAEFCIRKDDTNDSSSVDDMDRQSDALSDNDLTSEKY